MSTFYAQPYSIDANGFYFDTLDQYEVKAEACKDCFGHAVEEFELQFIDGDAEDAQTFSACKINQSNIRFWFEDVECLIPSEKAALYFLCDVLGCKPEDSLRRLNDVCLYSGTLKDAAEELFDEIFADQIPENLRHYIDYDRFARDCEIGGEMTEFEFSGDTFTCTNASSL